MHEKPLILFLTLGVLAGSINAAQRVKLNSTPKPRSACAIVTKAEIEQALGTTLGKGMPQTAAHADGCAYGNPKGGKVEIVVFRSQGKRDLSTLVAEAQKALPQAKIRELPGLGDKALLVEDPKGGTILSVYRGSDSLAVSVNGIGNSARAEAAVEKIVRKAFSRF